MRPPKRRRVENRKEEFTPASGRWTTKELSQLLTALKNHPREDVDKIAAYVPTRTRGQVDMELKRFQLTSRYDLGLGAQDKEQNLQPDTPIEVWMRLAQELVHGDTDLSMRLERVMSVMSTCEPHQPPVRLRFPDYGLIYKYLAALFAHKPLPHLPRIEAAVILSILQGMAHEFSSLDVTSQRKLMERKLELLTERTDNSKKGRAMSWELRRRALIEDPNLLGPTSAAQPGTSSGTQQIPPANTVSSNSKVTVTSQSAQPANITSQSASTSDCTSQSTGTSQSAQPANIASQSAGPTDCTSQSTGTGQSAQASNIASQSASTTDCASQSTGTGQLAQSTDIAKQSASLTDSASAPATVGESSTSTNSAHTTSQAESSSLAEPGQSQQGTSGTDQSGLNPSAPVTVDSQSQTRTHTSMGQSQTEMQLPHAVVSAGNSSASVGSTTADSRSDTAGPDSQPTAAKHEAALPKKSAMFSLNPFCIPIKYLHIATKVKEVRVPSVPASR